MHEPLKGVRVLDLSRLIPGPFCTLILSDLGASVDKLEDPHVGDYLRLFPPHKNGLAGRFNALNRDKRSLCLDLKQPAGRAALLQVIAHYDVLVESFRPGVMERLGVGWTQLSATNPRLVMLSISGYGQTGPLRDKAGHDLNYLAIGGVLGLAGPADAAPATPAIQLADIAGGALFGAVGILAALYERERTGRGQVVDVSMCEGALAFLIPDLGNFDADGQVPKRGGELLNGGAASYRAYRTKDGRYLAVGALEPKFWAAFNAAIGRASDASELVAPAEQQARIATELQAILGCKTRDEWEAVLVGDVCVEPVLAPDEVVAHAQHAARERFFDVDGMRMTRMPLGRRARHAAPPQLGADSAEILREAGVTDEAIAGLRATGVTK
ncbi:MAG TPA: CaiB/BaiF CoA-transferase family protein [Polyangia bacterium]|jgi:crotonobetainyl-CoA:carnitine CoA-transferase CaiB-like acyl-CoA transferase|nr:CaiB/BaiF CoA-transferase family protein [Polyangia bacterium]